MGWNTRVRKFNPCHDPDDGKFASKPCAGDLAGDMSRALSTAGGFTFEPRTKSVPTKGFAVGGFGTKPSFDLKDFRQDAVEKFLAENAGVLKEGAYIGGWVDEGKVYLDVTKIFDDKDKAIKAGIEKNQIAIADMSKIAAKDFENAFINTGGTGKRDSKKTMFLFDHDASAKEIFEALTSVKKYDPWQPRHPKGHPEGGKWKAGPIHTSDIEVAIMALQRGIPVELDQPDQISTLLDRLQVIAKEMEAAGELAPTVNLCQVSVKGTNLFCADSLGIERIGMPQLKGKPVKGSLAAQNGTYDDNGRVDITGKFIDSLQRQGYSVTEDVELAAYLRPTQNQLKGTTVARIMTELRNGFGTPKTIVISSDNYILDGHHHWAATVGLDYADNAADMYMPVLRVNTKIIDLLQKANKFTSQWGIPHKKREDVQSIAKTLYVRRDLENASELVAWAKAVGFKTTLVPEKMHVTVIFSKTPCDWTAMRPAGEPEKISVPGGKRSIERLGPDAVVLRFESDYLTGRCNDLKSKGAVSDFPDYKAHVTITWDAPDLDVEEFPPFLGPLHFGPEIFEEVNEKFRDTIVEKAYNPNQPRDPKGAPTGGQWTSLVSRAKKFATEAHGAQKRKYTGEPYTVHLAEVAGLVREAGLDEDVQAAAWLHDVLEDTPVTEATMRAEFGDLIASYVKQVTDVSRPWDGNRAARKALDRAHLSHATFEGASIKLADMISNTISISEHDPNFARVYLPEKEAILNAMKGGEPSLRAKAVQALTEAQAKIFKYDDNQPRAPKGTSEGGQWVKAYHGTKTPGFTEFSLPDPGQYMPDRGLGVHVALDPEIANTFTGEIGAIYQLEIPPDEKFYEIDQPLLPYVEAGTPKTSRNVYSDQNSVETEIYRVAYAEDPAMFARFLAQRWNMAPDLAMTKATDILAGVPTSLLDQRKVVGLNDYISFDGVVKAWNETDRAKAVTMFRDKMKALGFVGVKYINTSPEETRQAKNPTSYIVFDPKTIMMMKAQKYDPHQPRNPKGTPTGGQWVGGPGERDSNDPDVDDWSGPLDAKDRRYVENNPVYHGTTIRVLDAIRAEGLKPSTEDHTFELPALYAGTRGQSVYMANDLDTAIHYAKSRSAQAKPGEKTGILMLKIAVPPTEIDKLRYDEFDQNSMRYVGTIKPEWIVDYATFGPGVVERYAWEPKWAGHGLTTKAGQVIYAVVVFEIVEKYDPSQPRDPKGSPTGGQWTDGGGGTGDAAQSYSRSAASVNRLLRGQKGPSFLQHATGEGDSKKAIAALDKALKEHVLHAPLTVYRGIAPQYWKELLTNFLDGKGTFTDRGFLSTTIAKQVATRFAGEGGGLLKIKLPTGTQAMLLGDNSQHPEEQEVVVQRGRKMRITNVDQKSRVVTVELV